MEWSRGRPSLRGLTAATIVAAAMLVLTPVAGARSFTGSTVAMRDGNPTLLVDGQPFFFYGAAFFYERIPAPQWRASMLALRDLGFNTLDLYVPWNWHEPGDGDFDFDGHSNARRNLRGVLALARELRFKLIVRPGPVIRNEWRNGGYPAWLLTRPEYGMPLHDVLEGRYPATATLQNANSDDAAAQWLANATHMTYARRWLLTVLREFAPVADLVVAVQLDDDQGAYIDNQTWPAPHFETYLRTLEAIVRGVIGPQLPVFINTYEMKVTASAPVWAMGNWYQSDAFSIGEHDRAAIEFSTGLLQTQTRFPVAMSEFQAGWLAAPEEPAPRPADPTNTTLALHTLLGMGMRGAIDFPAQDTIDPAGWEAPFANESYLWDAALHVDLTPSARALPTKRFGDIVRAHGRELADARRLADGAIAYLTSAYDPSRMTNADVFGIAALTQRAQQACRLRHLTCDLVDLRFTTDAALRRYPFTIVPRNAGAPAMIALVRERLARYSADGGRIVARPPDVITPRNGGIADATVLLARDGAAYVDIVNYDPIRRAVPATHLALPGGRSWDIAPFVVPARDAVLLRRDPSGSITALPSTAPAGSPVQSNSAQAAATPMQSANSHESAKPTDRAQPLQVPQLRVDDRAVDGYPRLTLTNAAVDVTLTPDAGARAFTFRATSGTCAQKNVFTSVGALRDDVAVQPPVSTTDRIGKYTRSFPAGMFNRAYIVEDRASRADAVWATLAYVAPDVVPSGARFVRTIALNAIDSGFHVDERVTFGLGPGAADQRAVRYDSFDTAGATVLDERTDGTVGFFYPEMHCVAMVAWPRADVEDAQLIPERTSTVVRLEFAPDRETHTYYTITPAAALDDARAILLKKRAFIASMH